MSGAIPEMLDEEGRPYTPVADPNTIVPSGQVIEVVPRGTRPVGDVGEGGTAPEQQSGPPAAEGAPPLPDASIEVRPPPAPEAPDGPVEGGPDLTEGYQEYRARMEEQRAVNAVRQRASARRRENEITVAQAQPPAPRPPRRTGRATPAATEELPEPEIVPPLSDEPGWGARVLRAAGTVMRHGADAVVQVPGGMVAAVRETFRASDDLANFITRTPSPEPGQARPADWAGHPGEAIAQTIERNSIIPAPSTGTGQIVHDVSQFVTGFIRGHTLLRRAGVLQGGGALRTAQRAAAAGAIADFMYNEADEANLLAVARQAGLPVPVLTEFLATDPTDEAALNRMRNAVVGSVTGAGVDAAIALLRAARAGFAARRAAQGVPPGGPTPPGAPGPATIAQAAGVAPNPRRDRLVVGDADQPLFRMEAAENATGPRGGENAARALTGVADDMATGGVLSGRQEAAGVYINWGRIATPEDVRGVLRDMAEANRGAIEEAQRGVQTNAETRRLAGMLNLTVDDLLSRQRGQPFNAETALAARNLYTASGEELLAAARAAAAPGAGALEQVAFRRMMAVHYAIQSEVLGARTETARALQAWAIPSTSGRDQLRMIQDLMEQTGGSDVSAAMARRMAILGDNLTPTQLAPALGAFVNRGWAGRSIEAIQQVWINALLSSPSTHIVNMLGNGLNLYLTVAERAMAGGIAGVRGAAPGEGVMRGEAIAMTYGLMTGWGDALRLAARSYRDDGAEVARLIGRQDLPRQGAISSQAWGVDAGSGLGRALDWTGHSFVSAPGRAMGAEDAFFKSMFFRMELHASSLREAYSRVAARGEETTAERVGAEMARIMRDPPEHVRMAAADTALYATFNREGGPIIRALMGLRTTESTGWNLAVSTALPFVRTPGNIFSYGFERTPLAPLVGTWRADIAAGGARRDLALARVAVGSLLLSQAYLWADAGIITGGGPDDPGERAIWNRTHQPYSARMGDTWVSYNRFDPFGFMFGLAADAADLARRANIEPEEVDDFQEISNAMVLMAARAIVNRSFMQGIARWTDAFNTQRPNPEGLVGGTIQSFAAPGLVMTTARALDPMQREAMNIMERIQARTPYLSQNLIPRRDFWGVPERHGLETIAGSQTAAAVAGAVSPARMREVRTDPVDLEMERLNLNVQGINRRQTFNGVAVNMREFPQALDRLRVLFGQEARVPEFGDLGLHDALAQMIRGEGPRGAEYAAGNDGELGSRARLIGRTITRFRQAAQQQVLREHRDLARYVAQRGDQLGQQRGERIAPMPVPPRAPLPRVDRSLPPQMR